MPRPKLHSDDAVLDAALGVLLRKGPSTATHSDVAEAVGLSRAALIQRFGDKATLHYRVMERMTKEVRDYFAGLDSPKDLDAAWGMIKDLVAGMGSGVGAEGHLLLTWGDVRDPALRALASERNRLVRNAIESRLPEGAQSPAYAAALVQAVIQGACMQWLAEPEGELSDFMIGRTRDALVLLYPNHPFD